MELKLSAEEVAAIRLDTKACAALTHFNNAGASLPTDVVVNTVVDYLREEALNGGYETEAKYTDELNGVYDSIANMLNADREEIAIFENASAAWMTAFKGLSFEDGDEIIATEMEYVTNLIGLVDSQNENAVTVKVIANDEDGNFSIEALKQAITQKTRLIVVTHISSSGGSILPIEEIGQIAEQRGILYLVDACQSAGQLPLDVKRIKCDMLSATGRKYLRAPRGTGFLFVKKASQDKIKPTLSDFVAAGNVSLDGYTLRADARKFELYEKSRALMLGLGKAIDYAMNIGLDRIWARIDDLASICRKAMRDIPGVHIQDTGNRLSGIIAFTVDGIDSTEVKSKLAKAGINVSIGGQQATPIYMEKNGLSVIVRVSIHYYNTKEEIESLCRELGLMASEV